MKIITASKDDASVISELMLTDLEKPNPLFPKEMIEKFKEHASKKKILKEFENTNLIGFVAVNNNVITNFIVGYQKSDSVVMIHYLSGNDITAKKALLKQFTEECKKRKIREIIADTFEFMQNNQIFKTKGFILTKKEKITENLELLWYRKNIFKKLKTNL
ncbi:hypothetical protein GOV04_00665 [Candidatus Woesearchaeota archaeon]|nr:hypothetical protein [Candidatus Woesearchaeota archaeon]